MSFTQPASNVHVRAFTGRTAELLLLSDLHWDNPHCDRDLLLRHLKQARAKNARILLNGDTFCAMQGAYDPRKNKDAIRPEHNVSNYLDALVNTAADWFAPWVDLIDFVGYGNHETSILKRQETDLCARFVERLNTKHGGKVQLGGYGGYYVAKMHDGQKVYSSYRLKYMHGFGGGGPVTKGIIQHSRMAASIHGADAVWMGHVHENYEQENAVEYLNERYEVRLRQVLNIRTATYKEEYHEGIGGWHVEKGSPPKPLGGRWLHLERRKDPVNGLHVVASTTKTT